jgi:hypothetical protein
MTRTTPRHLAIVGAACTLCFLVLFRPWDGGGCDQVYHYCYLSSVLFDGDLDTANDFALSANSPQTVAVEAGRLTPKGVFADRFPVGNALLWAPFVAPVRFVGLAWQGLDSEAPAWTGDRYSAPYRVAVSLGTLCCGVAAILLAYGTCRMVFRARASLLAALGAGLASPLLAYAFDDPAASHAQAAFSVALLVWLSFRHRKFASVRSYFCLALALALATLVRWQDVVFGLIPLALWLRAGIAGRFRGREIAAAGAVAAGTAVFLAAVSPQPAYWHAWFGQAFAVPQGDGYLNWRDPRIASLLFSGWHGLYYWHPLLLVGTAGLVAWAALARRRIIPLAMLACLAVAVYVNSCVWDWFGNASFGARRFCSCVPLFALGLAAVWDRLRGRWAAVPAIMTVVAVLANVLVLCAYSRRMFDPFFASEVWALREEVPGIMARWLPTIPLQSSALTALSIGEGRQEALVLLAAGIAAIAVMAAAAAWAWGRQFRTRDWWLGVVVAILVAASALTVASGPPVNAAGMAFTRAVDTAATPDPGTRRATLRGLAASGGLPAGALLNIVLMQGDDTVTSEALRRVRAASPTLWADWVRSMSAGRVPGGQRAEADALRRRRPPSYTVAAAVRADACRQKEDVEGELKWLRRSLAYNPLQAGQLLRAADLEDGRGNAAAAAADRALARRFLRVRSDSFFRHAERVKDRVHAFHNTVYRDPVREHARLMADDGKTTRALLIYTRLEGLGLLDDEGRRRMTALRAESAR